MEQEPIRGQVPLEPPDARVAQGGGKAARMAALGALDALPRVAQLRDRVLDRRRLGWIALVDAIVPTAAFVSWFLAQLMPDASMNARPLPTLALLIVVLLWDQLSRGLRERYGVRQAVRGARRAVQLTLMSLGAGLFVLAMFLMYARQEVLAGLVVAGAAAWLGGGLWVWGGMMRDARDTPRVAPAGHAELNAAARVATACFGVGLGLIAVVVPWSVAGGLFPGFAVVSAIVALGIAGVGRFVNAVPELGAAWRPAQWTVFGLSAAIVCAAPILSAARPAEGALIGAAAGAAVLVLFTGAALWPAGSDA